MTTEDPHAQKLMRAKKRWRRVRHSFAAGMTALMIPGMIYLTNNQPPPAPTEIRTLHKAEQTLYWMEQVNEQGKKMPQNSQIEGIVTKFTNDAVYQQTKQSVEVEINRLETLPVVQEYIQGCEDYEKELGKRALITFPLWFGVFGLGMIPYFRERKKFYDTYQEVIDEQMQSMGTGIEKIFEKLDARIKQKIAREKGIDL